MRLPDFLIIGAMKSGTTTLFRDLEQHPQIYFPDEKEPTDLTTDDVLTDAGKNRYSRLFKSAAADQMCGEASTASTKMPDIPGVPRRARQLMSDKLKLIYIVRDPVERVISHHRFGYIRGQMPRDLATAIQEFPELIHYSQYKMQVDAWLQEFPQENLRIEVFEDYVKDRGCAIQETWSFLGLTSTGIELDSDNIENKSSSALIPKGWIGRIIQSKAYRRTIKNFFPGSLRRSIRRRVLPTADDLPDEPSESLREEIQSMLVDDTQAFVKTFGISPGSWSMACGQDSR